MPATSRSRVHPLSSLSPSLAATTPTTEEFPGVASGSADIDRMPPVSTKTMTRSASAATSTAMDGTAVEVVQEHDGDVAAEDPYDDSEDEEEALPLLPPPPSWFKFDRDVEDPLRGDKDDGGGCNDRRAGGSEAMSGGGAARDAAVPSFAHSGPAADGSSRAGEVGAADKKEESGGEEDGRTPDVVAATGWARFDDEVHCDGTAATSAATLGNCDSSSVGDESTWSTAIHRTATEVLPAAARELVSSSFRKTCHRVRLGYHTVGLRRYRRHSDLGYAGGYNARSWVAPMTGVNGSGTGNGAVVEGRDKKDGEGVSDNSGERAVANGTGHAVVAATETDADAVVGMDGMAVDLPPFSSLPWVDRQLVKEWRTCGHTFPDHSPSPAEPDHGATSRRVMPLQKPPPPASRRERPAAAALCDDDDSDPDADDDEDYTTARTLIPRPLPRPSWEMSSSCHACRRLFGPTLHRHHCRLCGHSYCHAHSNGSHLLPHLGYDPDVPERVCGVCKSVLEVRNLAERVAWRRARVRDLLSNDLTPYFETGVDTVEDAAYRLTRAALKMARNIPLGAQATVAVETVEVLRKHGLKGVYGLVLRKEFLAAADLLCKVTGINKRAWPLSVHELSAAIFYALAQHRAMRGLDPEREHWIHTLRDAKEEERDQEGNGGDQEAAGDGGKEIIDNIEGGALIVDGANSDTRPAPSPIGGGKMPSSSTKTCDLGNGTTSDVGGDSKVLAPVQEEEIEDDDGGDMIVWGGERSKPATAVTPNVALDETDAFDPMSESVADLLAMADHAIHSQRFGEISMDENVANSTPEGEVGGSEARDGRIGVNIAAEGTMNELERSTAAFQSQSAPTKLLHSHSALVSSQPASEGGTSRSEPPSRHLPFSPVCDPVSDSLLSSLLFYAPLALNFIYATSEVDMQLLAAQQNWRLLYAHLEQDHTSGGHGGGYAPADPDEAASAFPASDRPASALFVHNEQRIACFAIRGTATIHDVVTDIRAMPVPFPEAEVESNGMGSGGASTNVDQGWEPVFRGQGLALCGMAGAAVNLFRENIDALLLLAQNGYRIRIVGHSLGGGVAALLGALVRRHLEQRVKLGDSLGAAVGARSRDSALDNSDLLRVYGYGTPACVDAKLSDYAQSYVTTIVLHDDVIPRLTPTSIRGLLKHLLHIRETWVKAHLTDDLMAITERATKVWAPRWRGSFTLLKSKASSLKKYQKRLRSQRRTRSWDSKSGDSAVKDLCAQDRPDESKGRSSKPSSSSGWDQKDVSNAEESTGTLNGDARSDDDDDERHAIDVDGDLFYEAEETLVESDDESIKEECRNDLSLDITARRKPIHDEDEWVPFDEPVPTDATTMAKDETSSLGAKASEGSSAYPGAVENKCDRARAASPPAVMLDEVPLPRMFVPGRIVHIYTHRGGYKATFVPRAFRELRRISLAGNMLTDHMSRAYYEALLETKSIRAAENDLPVWTTFGEESTCSCCASQFTWASTSDSEAQEARDKHNCRSCGTLVCDPCSRNRVPIPSIGIVVPVRVCDRCYNDLGSVSIESDALARSFIDDVDTKGEVENGGKAMDTCHKQSLPRKRTNARPRRSVVVDELASRIPSVST